MIKKVSVLWIIISLAVTATSGAAVNTDWDKTLAAAKSEGKITIAASAASGQREALRNGFGKAFGINIDFLSGRGGELREKIYRERRVGLYLVDLITMGPSGLLSDLKPAGILDPIKPMLVLPDVVNPSAWYGGRHTYLDKEQNYVFGFTLNPRPYVLINSQSVKPGDLKTHADLLQPRWKGKIVINDPTTTGPGQMWFQMASKSLGSGFMKELAKQEVVITRDLRQQAEWIARGKYLVLLGPHETAVAEFKKAGASVDFISLSDMGYASSGTGSIALINKPAHPNAAKVFINWLLTREGQTIYSRAFALQSTRLDVPTDHLDKKMVRQPGVTYNNASFEDFALERETIEKEAKAVFGL